MCPARLTHIDAIELKGTLKSVKVQIFSKGNMVTSQCCCCMCTVCIPYTLCVALKAQTTLAQMVIDWNLANRKSFLKHDILLNTGM